MEQDIDVAQETDANMSFDEKLAKIQTALNKGNQKKGKKRYTRGLEDIQVSGYRMTRSGTRIARAINKGVKAYRKSSRRSSKRYRDGAIVQFPLDAAEGLSEGLRVVSVLPLDIAKSITGKSYRKTLRRPLKTIGRILRDNPLDLDLK